MAFAPRLGRDESTWGSQPRAQDDGQPDDPRGQTADLRREVFNLPKAKVLADTLDAATGKFLEFDRSPGRKLGTIDNRGSHFYLALYWAQALAAQDKDTELKAIFTPVAAALTANEETIVSELLAVQGKPVDIGGYYLPDEAKATAALRPSETFNHILATI